MKRKHMLIFFSIATVLMLGIIPFSALAQDNIKVMVNNQPVAFPDQQPFINKDYRTLVPVRAPMEAAGAAVTWNDTDRQATVAKGDKTAVFTIGSRQYTVNGEIKQMDTEAQIAGSRTVFPIRFVAEAIGLTVTWDENTQTVGITAPAAAANNAEIKPGTTQPEVTTPSTQSQKPMTSLTAEAKARLMAYPYLDKAGKAVEVYSAMVKYKEEGIKVGISETDSEDITRSWLSQKSLIKPNQSFYFDADLCFTCSGKYPDRVRGVLQTQNSDGTFTEQDVELGFVYGTYFVSEGETSQSSHLMEGNDFIALAPPIKF